MQKCCSNCGLYLKVKGNTELGKIYYCHPTIIKKIKKEELSYYSCGDWRDKIPNEVNDLFGFLKSKK